MNLPMVIEAYASRFSMESAHEIAANIIKTATDGVKVKPESLEPVNSDKSPEDSTKQSNVGASMESAHEIAANIIKTATDGVKVKPESLEPVNSDKSPEDSTKQSNVGAPGSFEYVLARIDSRLLHGQIATAWTKTVKPTRIIVVSDNVAKDELRKKLIQQAAPPGVKAHTVPISQMIKLAKDDKHFGGQRALLLFENPEDLLRAVEGGVPIKTVNVGSMAHSPGKVQPNKVLAFSQEDIDAFNKLKKAGLDFDVRKVPNDFSQEDIDTFNKLKEAGLDFDVRKVPNDSKGNMDEILKKAQEELNKLK